MAQFRKYEHSNVGLPSNLLHAIGHVAAMWARIEFEIDSNINRILTYPGAPKANPKLILPFRQRLDLLDDLCRQFLTDHEHLVHSAEIIAALKPLASQRNLIVHGVVSGSRQRRGRQQVYWFRRVAWEPPTRIIEKRAFTVSQVEGFAAKLSDYFAYAQLIEVFFWSVERALNGKSAPVV